MKARLTLILTLSVLLLGQALAITNLTFPDYFKFGAATASYQVEGAWKDDGKGENIWDHICHTQPDYILKQYNGDVAADSYHKYKEDVQMLKNISADFYRYSISWSRILPAGVAGSAINKKGVEYYRNLTKELLDNKIEPLVTIFHWDLPQQLQDLGGFPNPEIVEHFAYYVRVLYQELGDLVKLWLTFNEPKQTCLDGYGYGVKAPAVESTGISDYLCTHNLLKSHAIAYNIYNEEFKAKQKGRVGIVIDSPWYEPATNSTKDQEAAERTLQFTFGWYAHPIYVGNYPQVMIDRIGERSKKQGYSISRLPKFTPQELHDIHGTHDFIAVNAYSSNYAEAIEEAKPEEEGYDTDLNVKIYTDPNWEASASSWLKVVPWGIRKLVNWVSKNYGNQEIFITENGFSDKGGLDDPRRINYYQEYLSALLEAIVIDKVNVTRYTAWSLMDNLEWTSGYTEKFGLYQVDFEDPKRTRTPKKSAAFYSNVIKTRCLLEKCGK